VNAIQHDLTILKKLNFEVGPVAVSFSIHRPEGIDRLEKKMTFCQMIKRSHEGEPFYADFENHECPVGPYLLGGPEVPRPFLTGEYGAGLKHFKEPRAVRRMYRSIPKLEKDIVHYVAFSTLDKLSFEPDVLILAADVEQAALLLRAMSYTTGKIYSSKFTSVMGCAWIFIYPYLTGELNYVPTGISVGMKLLKVFREGLILMSIPYDLLPTVLKNLQEMPWVLPMFQSDGEEFRNRLRRDLAIDQ
jgi:uncharacterized protein (DUF169 family)